MTSRREFLATSGLVTVGATLGASCTGDPGPLQSTASGGSAALLAGHPEHPEPASFDRLSLDWHQATVRRLQDRASSTRRRSARSPASSRRTSSPFTGSIQVSIWSWFGAGGPRTRTITTTSRTRRTPIPIRVVSWPDPRWISWSGGFRVSRGEDMETNGSGSARPPRSGPCRGCRRSFPPLASKMRAISASACVG
jgi:hypothetical protein